jgi:hypothetical protein
LKVDAPIGNTRLKVDAPIGRPELRRREGTAERLFWEENEWPTSQGRIKKISKLADVT